MSEVKVNLDAPAFGAGSDKAEVEDVEKGQSLGDMPASTLNDDLPMRKVEVKEEVDEPEEGRVPFSRFKTIADQKRQAEEEAMASFETGATRNRDEHKPDYEGFFSPYVFERYGEYMSGHRRQKDGMNTNLIRIGLNLIRSKHPD